MCGLGREGGQCFPPHASKCPIREIVLTGEWNCVRESDEGGVKVDCR